MSGHPMQVTLPRRPMWALDDFGRDRGLVPHHLECLRAEAAENRQAREVRHAPPFRTRVGVQIMACGHVLIRAGERLSGPWQPTRAGSHALRSEVKMG